MIGIVAAAYMTLQLPDIVDPAPFYEEGYEVICKDNDYYLMMDQEDIDLLARVVMSEAGGQSDDCKEAVATVILNRLASPDYPVSLKEVIYQRNQFSTANNGEPTKDCYLAVYSALIWFGTDDQIVPKSCYYFRSGHYHTWALNYKQIDDLYFSLPKNASID